MNLEYIFDTPLECITLKKSRRNLLSLIWPFHSNFKHVIIFEHEVSILRLPNYYLKKVYSLTIRFNRHRYMGQIYGKDYFNNSYFSKQYLKNYRLYNLKKIKNLKYLDISGSFKKVYFFNLEIGDNLKYLNCSKNNIFKIKNLENLVYLNCSNCNLTELPCLKKIKYLDCPNNYISNIRTSEMKKLKYIFCSDNYFSEENIFSMTEIKYLKLENNYFDHFVTKENIDNRLTIEKLNTKFSSYTKTRIYDMNDYNIIMLNIEVFDKDYYPKNNFSKIVVVPKLDYF